MAAFSPLEIFLAPFRYYTALFMFLEIHFSFIYLFLFLFFSC